jgi:hypothetical protein
MAELKTPLWVLLMQIGHKMRVTKLAYRVMFSRFWFCRSLVFYKAMNTGTFVHRSEIHVVNTCSQGGFVDMLVPPVFGHSTLSFDLPVAL